MTTWLFIRENFDKFFNYTHILRVIDGACKKRKIRLMHLRSEVWTNCVDRYKIASGKLPAYDVSEVIQRLTLVKYVTEEFQWDVNSAGLLVKYHDYDIDFEDKAKAIRLAKDRCRYHIMFTPFQHYMGESSYLFT